MLSIAEATASLGQTVTQMIPTLYSALIGRAVSLSLGVNV
ncbi:hypothetical protein RE9431_09370 [Prescottella equi]|nr:hypothetical protein RE9431_09370 [Prescottella equi]BCN72335.1 hypothetical protein RE0327_09340 [Prescottella equi]BCN82304.1 hypothetical protein RE0356_09450 [Prescottella equi]BDC71099.1 hypothetical protein KAREA_10140 [Prescottella equi]